MPPLRLAHFNSIYHQISPVIESHGIFIRQLTACTVIGREIGREKCLTEIHLQDHPTDGRMVNVVVIQRPANPEASTEQPSTYPQPQPTPICAVDALVASTFALQPAVLTDSPFTAKILQLLRSQIDAKNINAQEVTDNLVEVSCPTTHKGEWIDVKPDTGSPENVIVDLQPKSSGKLGYRTTASIIASTLLENFVCSTFRIKLPSQ